MYSNFDGTVYSPNWDEAVGRYPNLNETVAEAV